MLNNQFLDSILAWRVVYICETSVYNFLLCQKAFFELFIIWAGSTLNTWQRIKRDCSMLFYQVKHKVNEQYTCLPRRLKIGDILKVRSYGRDRCDSDLPPGRTNGIQSRRTLDLIGR